MDIWTNWIICMVLISAVWPEPLNICKYGSQKGSAVDIIGFIDGPRKESCRCVVRFLSKDGEDGWVNIGSNTQPYGCEYELKLKLKDKLKFYGACEGNRDHRFNMVPRDDQLLITVYKGSQNYGSFTFDMQVNTNEGYLDVTCTPSASYIPSSTTTSTTTKVFKPSIPARTILPKPTTTPTPTQDNQSDLPIIIGSVVCIVFLLICAIIVAIFFLRRKKRLENAKRNAQRRRAEKKAGLKGAANKAFMSSDPQIYDNVDSNSKHKESQSPNAEYANAGSVIAANSKTDAPSPAKKPQSPVNSNNAPVIETKNGEEDHYDALTNDEYKNPRTYVTLATDINEGDSKTKVNDADQKTSKTKDNVTKEPEYIELIEQDPNYYSEPYKHGDTTNSSELLKGDNTPIAATGNTAPEVEAEYHELESEKK